MKNVLIFSVVVLAIVSMGFAKKTYYENAGVGNDPTVTAKNAFGVPATQTFTVRVD